nr:right-handed parallel beta-helix repeat-containing protein [Pseudonocardia acidicola]
MRAEGEAAVRSRRGKARRGTSAALAGAAALGLGLLTAVPAAAQPAKPIVVGVAGPACPAPAFATITAAATAAPAGSTITVCPGTYTGTVVVTKPLTFLGARRGVDARTGRTNPLAESVVDGGGGAGFRIEPGVSGVTIDGFTIRNAGTPQQRADGIDAFNGGSGFTIADNIITETSFGVNLNSNGATPSTITRNRFVDNNRTGGQGGSGVFVSSGPGNNLAIIDNLFRGHSSAAVNTAGDPSRASTGLRIERNQSIDDATFAVIVNARGASVANNQIVRAPATAVPIGSAILVGGNTTGVMVAGNAIAGGDATGIRVSNAFGPPNVGLTVAGNQIVNRQDGIRLTRQTSGRISGNEVAGSSNVGILLDRDADAAGMPIPVDNTGVTVSGNQLAGNRVADCQDTSSGTGTAGTANTWTGNIGFRSSPAGLCSLF